MSKQLYFYDFEIFKHDALIVIKDINKKVIRAMWNDFTGLIDVVDGYKLVGYNNYHYDDYILSRMLSGDSPEQLKRLNDRIIGKQNFVKYIHPSIDSLDVFQQVDVSMPSLKKIEGNMGKMILESSVDFTIDRKLTHQERDEVLDYCSYDIDTTIDVHSLREGNYFRSKAHLIDMLENPRAERWNTTTISANLLLRKPLPKWASIRVPEEMMDLVPPHVRDMWIQKSKNMDAKIKKTTVEEFDNVIDFAFGGLHGAHKSIKRAKNVKLWDVTSMYPNIIILLGVLGHSTNLYKDMLLQRIAVKHTNTALSDALKLVLNSVYGNLKNKYSLLYNPRASLTVCVYGQIALYELCRRLSPYVTIININTDGVAFIPHDDRYEMVKSGWEKDFTLGLEEELFTEWIQKDVNNYIAVRDDGKLITKGGDVSRYERDKLFSNNSTRIVDIAIVNKLLYGIDPIDTLMRNSDNPLFFQYILQAGRTYKGTFDIDDNKYNKINRVFAVKNNGVQLQKKRMDDGLVRFADAPESMMVFNNDLEDLDMEQFKQDLDLNHYYKLINKKLNLWTA